jgi:hypothetical protein
MQRNKLPRPGKEITASEQYIKDGNLGTHRRRAKSMMEMVKVSGFLVADSVRRLVLLPAITSVRWYLHRGSSRLFGQ